MLPRSWIPPEEIQRLRDLTRLRQALRHDRTSWAQRLHAVLAHEGWPCSRSELLSTKGRRWLAALTLDPHVRGVVDAHLAILDALATQMTEVERELRGLARSDRRLLALQTIYGGGGELEWFGWFFDQGFMSWDETQRQFEFFAREIIPHFR